MNTLSLSRSIEGFFLEAGARRLSPNTIRFYRAILVRFQKFFDADPLIGAITKADLQRFMISLDHLSKKTALGHHAGLSALWRWALSEELVERNLVREIPAPVPEQHTIIPFTQVEVKALLGAVDKSMPYARLGQRECQHSNPEALRNRVIIYLLLDTGIRASELCGLRVRNLDLKARHVTVMGKGSKERTIYFSEITAKVIWRYLAQRSDESLDAWMFPAWHSTSPLDARDLYHVLHRIGQRAGVADVHPHRFRYTFAIQYLRNKGDVYTLQRILGHTTLDMVRRYLAIAQTDIEAAHRLASPVANWRL